MTDNEIIKALECFAIDKDFDDTHCIGCAFEHKFCTANMSEDIAIPSLDLINRQKAEIERLKTNLSVELENFASEYDNKIKSEAIKEFAERLQSKLAENTYLSALAFQAAIYDMHNLVKEMAGDDK